MTHRTRQLANCIDYERKADHFPEMRRMMIEDAEREALRAAVRKSHPHIGDAK